MRSLKLLVIAFLLCILSPALSFADQFEVAMLAMVNKDFKKACELLAPLAKENNLLSHQQLKVG